MTGQTSLRLAGGTHFRAVKSLFAFAVTRFEWLPKNADDGNGIKLNISCDLRRAQAC
jgi:hypothetical protein